MGKGRLDRALGRFSALLEDHVRADGELLELFVQKKDETAFAAVVRRQGPMVLGVCRRILGNEHDAEDAFQATFLVLARKAESVRPRNRVANWLYGVAYRIALEARRAVARRRAREAKAVPKVTANDEQHDDLRQILDEELARLPDRFREVIVLCELESQSRKEVARQLGCPEGTVASRLARARGLLAKRLARRGLAFSAGGVAAMLTPNATLAVPPSLASATVKAATLVAAGQTMAAGAASAQVTFLAERVVRIMFFMKLKAITVVLFLVGVFGGGVGLAYYQTAKASPSDSSAETTAPGRAQAASPKDPRDKETEELRNEIDLLKRRNQKLKDFLGFYLEEHAKTKGAEGSDVLFKGKPASFWLVQLKDRDPEYRIAAVKALGGIGEVDPSVLPALIGALQDMDAAVCMRAAESLMHIGDTAIPGLIAALIDPHVRKKEWIAYTLGVFRQGAARAVPALTQLVKSATESERLTAVKALEAMGPEAKMAVPALIPLLKDHTKSDCFFAAKTIGQIGPEAKAAVPALAQLLKDRQQVNLEVNGSIPEMGGAALYFNPALEAAQALAKIGPAAKAAVPALLEALKDIESSAPARRPGNPRGRPPGGQSFNANRSVFIFALQNIDPTALPKEGVENPPPRE